MSFLFATAVLLVTLVAAALIAPRPFHDRAMRVDPCALQPAERGVIDPTCPDVRASWTRVKVYRSTSV